MAPILTEEQKKSPLYKYIERPIAPCPEEVAKEIMQMNYDNQDGMAISDINKLFDDGYLPNEFGMYGCPDGGTMLANLTDMPGVDPVMFDWWFAWHGLDTMRYMIWDKDDHFYCQTQNVEQALDESLSLKERYWNTTHEIKEGLFDGDEPRPVMLTFVPPEVVGFDPEKLKDFKGTIICTPGPAIMIHFLRPTANGSELRTRFFMGYQATENGVIQIPDFPAIPEFGRMMLMHNVKEFTHLAKILPEVYNEFKDDFTVGLK
ncbi:MAG: phloretin hydrolase [Parasporobacterium sp.]|nr:phloretin hydrolase [Parasporobacterium sp.]